MACVFEKLLVSPKAIDFSDAICAKSECLPRGYLFGSKNARIAPSY